MLGSETNPENPFIEILRRSGLDPEAAIALDSITAIIARQRQENEVLKEQALVDALTGVGNWRALDRKKNTLEKLMLTGDHRSGEAIPHAVVVLSADVINLKGYNAISPATGNEAIRIVARSLRAALQRDDELFRSGGDEFVAHIPVFSEQGIEVVMQKIRSIPPLAYRQLRLEAPHIPFPETIPILCGSRIFRAGGKYKSLDEAEQDADPKSGDKARIKWNIPKKY